MFVICHFLFSSSVSSLLDLNSAAVGPSEYFFERCVWPLYTVVELNTGWGIVMLRQSSDGFFET